jgi:hypothetical protein
MIIAGGSYIPQEAMHVRGLVPQGGRCVVDIDWGNDGKPGSAIDV